ncbi:MAG: hypothetical protein RLZZ297_333 [Chloroflexota bacterium]|jgi:nucleotidyltransferase substrate binding protein (TIGR01987 family)
MTEHPIDLTPLQRAIDRLGEGWERYQRDTNDIQIRDGLIQRFEFTYELSHKMLKRVLERNAPSTETFDTMSFADLIRNGNEHGLLLGTWVEWKQYREMRSRTSHSYDEDVALQVVSGIPAFISEARFLVGRLAAYRS